MEKQMNQWPTAAIWNCPDKYIIPEHRRARSPSVIETGQGASLRRHTQWCYCFRELGVTHGGNQAAGCAVSLFVLLLYPWLCHQDELWGETEELQEGAG